MTEEVEEGYWKNKTCRFCEKKFEFDKLRDHSHLAGEYRDPAQANVILVSHRNTGNSYHLYLTILVLWLWTIFQKIGWWKEW